MDVSEIIIIINYHGHLLLKCHRPKYQLYQGHAILIYFDLDIVFLLPLLLLLSSLLPSLRGLTHRLTPMKIAVGTSCFLLLLDN